MGEEDLPSNDVSPVKKVPRNAMSMTNFFCKVSKNQVIKSAKRVLEGGGSSQEVVDVTGNDVHVDMEEREKPVKKERQIELINLSDGEEDDVDKQQVVSKRQRKITIIDLPKDNNFKNTEDALLDVDPLLAAAAANYKSQVTTKSSSLVQILLVDHSEKIFNQSFFLPSEDAIWPAFRNLCKIKKRNGFNYILCHKGVKLFSSTTPSSLGISVGNIQIDVYLEGDFQRLQEENKLKREALLTMSDTIAPISATDSDFKELEYIIPEDSKSISLRIKSRKKADPVTLKISSNAKFETIYSDIRLVFGLDEQVTALKLVFDGTTINGSSTPASLEMEEDDLLELCL